MHRDELLERAERPLLAPGVGTPRRAVCGLVRDRVRDQVRDQGRDRAGDRVGDGVRDIVS